jgi:hypothetical protein
MTGQNEKIEYHMQKPGTDSRNLHYLFSYLLLGIRQSKLILTFLSDFPNDKICIINTVVLLKNIHFIFLIVAGKAF